MHRAIFYILIAAVLTVVSFTASQAASLLDEDEAPVASRDAWTGFWVGVAAGGQFGNSELTYKSYSIEGLGNDGVVGCIRGGYDHQFRGQRIVAGLWGEGCLSTAESEVLGYTIEEDYSAAFGGRLGVLLWEHTLGYTKVGYRVSDVSFPGGSSIGDETFGGFLVGAGIESFVAPNITVGAEFDYTDYGDENIGGVDVEREDFRGMISAGYRF